MSSYIEKYDQFTNLTLVLLLEAVYRDVQLLNLITGRETL
jgi:hypothetical protein